METGTSPSTARIARRIATHLLPDTRESDTVRLNLLIASINAVVEDGRSLGPYTSDQVTDALHYLGHIAHRGWVKVLSVPEVAALDTRVLDRCATGGDGGPLTVRGIQRLCNWQHMPNLRLRGCLHRLITSRRLVPGPGSTDQRPVFFVAIMSPEPANPSPEFRALEAFRGAAVAVSEAVRLLGVAEEFLLSCRPSQPAESPAVAAEPSAGAPGDPGAAAGL